MDYNYHTHTKYCHHATDEMEDYVKNAIEGGMHYLGFSEHSPFRFPDGYETTYHRIFIKDVPEYLKEANRLREAYKDKIDIKIGYEMEYYPIPVISIIDYCDIEVGIDKLSISAKLSKVEAEVFDYSLLEKYEFEAYGIEHYLDDFYSKGSTIDEFINRVKVSNEQEIGFSFIFDDLDEDGVYAFVEFLIRNKFFY